MFTFRGIPCIYYGSEIEFKKGKNIDPANQKTTFEESGRAYYGENLEGDVTATFTGIPNGTYTDAITGNKAIVSDGTLTTDAISKPNMRIYVLDTSKTKAPGKLSGYSPYLK